MATASNLKSYWHNLRAKVLSLPQPLTTFHWRFLWPNQNKYIKLHRYVFFHAYGEYPALLRGVMYLYNLSRWWLYFAWFAIYKSYTYNKKSCFEKYQISPTQQLKDIVVLAFVYCIPPMEYYAMRLHQWPKSQWLAFVYDFQANAWHQAFNYKKAKNTQNLINDKAEFAAFLRQNNLATVPSLLVIKQGEKITIDQLQNLPQTSFFKPTSGNQGIGCFTLVQDDTIEYDAKLRFIWFKDASERPYKDLKNLNQLIANKTYLVQPVVENHPDFTDLFDTNRLATIRLTTCHINNSCHGLTAVLEIPKPDKPMFYFNVSIDIKKGTFITPCKVDFDDNPGFDLWFGQLKGKTCPQWQAILSLCLQAHQILPKQLTIGWDVALTAHGPIIVEGNVNWGVRQHQVITQTPMLCSALIDTYTQRMV